MSDSDSGLLSHIEALRSCILKTLLIVAVLFPVAFHFSGDVITLLARHACPPELGELHYFSPMEVFLSEMKLALLLAFAAGLPLIEWVWWGFLLPALYPNERKILGGFIVFSTLLFFVGSAFALFAILPPIMRFSAGFSGPALTPMIGLGSFLSLAVMLLLAFAAMFQTPVVVCLAVRLRLVKTATLKYARPYVAVILLVIAALLTPPDVISQLALFLPTWLLFEAGLLFASRCEPKD